MSLSVVAEGVETPVQRAKLLDLGFREAQGFLFAQAQPAAELHSLLNQSYPNLADNDGSLEGRVPFAMGANTVPLRVTAATTAPID